MSFLLQFLREELQYDSGYERRQQAFHYNDDTHISAKELWEAWRRSEVQINTGTFQFMAQTLSDLFKNAPGSTT